MPVLAHQHLVQIIRGVRPMITAQTPIKDENIQMASIDLTLGDRAYCMRASARPSKDVRVQHLIDAHSKNTFALTTEDKILYRHQTYIVPLNEGLRLAKGFSAKFSPKSSIGRIDVLVRILADGTPRFDHVPEQYEGPLYLEITPLSFDIFVRSGNSLVQMRIKKGAAYISGSDVALRHAKDGLVWGKNCQPLPSLTTSEQGVYMHVDLEREVVGFMARDPVMNELSLSKPDGYEPEEFWEEIRRPASRSIIINPNRFYLLATKERIKIPHDLCGDIAPYDASAGEFRSHYAGFFDPGFGGSKPEDRGTVGVMEVRGREIPFKLEDGQPICRMDFEKMDEIPDIMYGVKNNYTKSVAALSKFFRRKEEVWKE